MPFKPVDPQVNFPELEQKLLKHWYESGIVDKYLHRNDSALQNFSFLDGPITANNPMGVHHAWGRTYKDLWQRFWNMRGYRQRFQNGFDCQGLWVEVEVEKELGLKSKKDIENLVSGDKSASIAKFIELCKERVLKYAAIQTEQSKRLGYFMDWENSYFTMSEANNYMIWHFLKRCHEKGYLYKGIDSVPWCPRCGTAISQHEMLTEDYKEVTHDSVFFRLPVANPPSGMENIDLLVWTTTPWTIPANVGVGVNKKFTYGIWRENKTKRRIIILHRDETGNEVTRTLNNNSMTVAEYIFGKEEAHSGEYTFETDIAGDKLIGLKYVGPFDELPRVQKGQEENSETFHTVVDGSQIVIANEGTGLLHVAPGAGQEDFQLGKKENLPVIDVINEEAVYLDGLGEFSGQNAKDNPEVVLKALKIQDDGRFWFKKQKITHRYPACWRCKTELVWRVVDEWYIAMDVKSSKLKTQNSKLKESKTLREQMIEAAKQIKWMPEFGLKRELDWLNNMHDWLISKKRYWGLALPIWECEKCENFAVIGGKEELKEKAAEGWKQFDGHTPHRPYVDEIKIQCDKCGGLMNRIPDVGNPWLDAGIVPFSTITASETSLTPPNPLFRKEGEHSPSSDEEGIKESLTESNVELGPPLYLTNREAWEQWFPADFITESFPGQFKNWFYSMIAMSTVLEDSPPYKRVLGFATLLAEDGRPMHKSWGNSIEFNQGADEIGVDVMRFMYAQQNPADNMLFGPKLAGLVRRKFHLMLWNVYNFFVTYANADGWKHTPLSKAEDPSQEGCTLDQWILIRLNQLIETATKSLESYDASLTAKDLQVFVDDLSLWYVRRSRTRLGPTATDEKDKQSAYQTLYEVLVTLSQLLAPIIPFMADDIYTNLTGEASVHLSDWPENNTPLLSKAEGPSQEGIIIFQMSLARQVVERGHAARKSSNLNVRQPLQSIKVISKNLLLSEDYLQLIKDELNVKEMVWKEADVSNLEVALDTTLTDELKAEGQAREIIRQIQVARKEAGCELTERVVVTLPDWPKEFEEDIKRQTLAKELVKGEAIQIQRNAYAKI